MSSPIKQMHRNSDNAAFGGMGISHGLKTCHWHVFLTPFRFPYGDPTKRKKDIRMDVLPHQANAQKFG